MNSGPGVKEVGISRSAPSRNEYPINSSNLLRYMYFTEVSWTVVRSRGLLTVQEQG